MTVKNALRKVIRTNRLPTSLPVVVVLLLTGCNQTDAHANGETHGESASKTAPLAADAVAQAAKAEGAKAEGVKPEGVKAEPTGQSEYVEEAFVVKIVAPDAVRVGVPAVFRVLLEAQSGYKVNLEYPLKFVVAEAPAIKAALTTVRKEDGKVEKKHAELPVSVTISQPGTHKVGGKLSFSVCTDERCLIEKRDLLVTVTAS